MFFSLCLAVAIVFSGGFQIAYIESRVLESRISPLGMALTEVNELRAGRRFQPVVEIWPSKIKAFTVCERSRKEAVWK